MAHAAVVVSLALAMTGQAAPADADKDAAAERLAFMRQSLDVYDVRSPGGSSGPLRLDRAPVMRFTNPIGDVKDGTIFLWRDQDGRPAAAVQVFWHINTNWYQEFSSLSPQPISAGETWVVPRSGIELKPISDVPRPADTAEQRQRQMRVLVGEFSGEEQLHLKSWQPLRVLTKPFARYGGPAGPVLDGALYAFVLTTDPEVYLVIEARQGASGPEWQYALAPASVDPVRIRWKKQEVWSLPFRPAWTDSRAPFYVHYFHRGLAKVGRAGSN